MISYLFQAIKELLDGCTDRPTDHDQLENTSNSSSRPTGATRPSLKVIVLVVITLRY